MVFVSAKKKKGFSLIELMVAMAVFVIVAVALTGIFSSSVFGYRSGVKLQKNLENAQYAMDLMAKTIRTSSVLNFSSPTALTVFDYSQGKCIKYKLVSGNTLNVQYPPASAGISDFNTCKAFSDSGQAFSDSYALISGIVDSVKFSAVQSIAPNPSTNTPGSVGKVTISMKVCSDTGCAGTRNQTMNIQTTVSLRDYSVSGL